MPDVGGLSGNRELVLGAEALRGAIRTTDVETVDCESTTDPQWHIEQTAPGGHPSSSHAPPCPPPSSMVSQYAYAVAIPLAATMVAARTRIRSALSIPRFVSGRGLGRKPQQ